WLQAFLHDLGLEGFGVRASLAHENPGDKGDRVRLKIGGHHRPSFRISEGVFAGRLLWKTLPKVKISISDAYFSAVETMIDFFNRIGQKESFAGI
ncbi:hypothetical protein TU75_21715, partial [Pseudomonas poae]|uniref:hypothetical protein n=1 Tax=Pseudomonas poae TaxID=200451 RepID=UPI000713A9D3